MHKRYRQSWYRTFFIGIIDDLILGIDQSLAFVYEYVELPIQKIFCYFGNISSYYYRRPLCFDFCKNLTQIFAQSYIITFILYFICLFFAYLFSSALQRYYFLDPVLANDRQCIDIQFVHIINHQYSYNNTRLRENFVEENLIIAEESYRKDTHDYTQLYKLFSILQDNYYMICQRSLYLYARFQTYSSLLYSNYSQFRFHISKYSSSFTIDQPPFLDLCVHTSNRSHTEQIQSQLLPLASYYYTSVNLFIFDFNFTQVSVTLYELNLNSTHLERVSIHTGWLQDMYSQFESFKYNRALSTVLFDGLAMGQNFVDYFQYIHVPVPSDPLLGLNEMIQESLLVLPLCRLTRNKL